MTLAIDLTGHTALVTGAGQGVGRAVSLYLAEAGAKVLVNDYVPERAESVAAEVAAVGGDASACPFDVADFEAVVASVEAEPVDILVNNAGNAGPPDWEASGKARPASVTSFAETDPADWTRYFAVNLYGVMHCTRACVPGMISKGGGRVITIISDAARVGEPRLAAYSAAKAGAAGFTRALAREVGRHGITVNNVALATVDTMGLEAMARDSEDVANMLRKQLKRYMIPRLGKPDDVAGLVTYLASPLASWITGQTYPVNGGYSVTQ